MDTNDKKEIPESRQAGTAAENQSGAARSDDRNNHNRNHSRHRPNHSQNHNRQGGNAAAQQGGDNARSGQPQKNNRSSQPRPEQKPRETAPAVRPETPSAATAAAPVSEAPREARTVWSSSGRRRPGRPVPPPQVKAPTAPAAVPSAPRNTAAAPAPDARRPQPGRDGGRPAPSPRQGQPEERQDGEQRPQRLPGQRPQRMPHKAPVKQELPQMDNLLIEDVPVEDAPSGAYSPDSDELERILQFELCTPQSRNIPDVIPEGKVVIVGVRFRAGGKTYFFAPGKNKCSVGQHAIVETARGMEYGEICLPNRMVDESLVVPPLRPLIRVATEQDIAHNQENHEKEAEAYRIGVEKINAHKLDMKLVTAQYTFDNSKLLFYFTSAGRVDFRELVRDLASVFHIRIELRQIGIRDEARMIGGLGACGRPLCCSTFLSDFGQVSMKMAKEQNLSLNSTKISGVCGRLMCCLRYEYDTYLEEYRRTPAPGTFVMTPDGPGVVTEVFPLVGEVKVSLRKDTEAAPKRYKREDVTLQPHGACPAADARVSDAELAEDASVTPAAPAGSVPEPDEEPDSDA